jgi:hypothetical protein
VLYDEPGRDVVVEIVNHLDADVAMHTINLLEVYYDIYRHRGKPKPGSPAKRLREAAACGNRNHLAGMSGTSCLQGNNSGLFPVFLIE